jgi:hypothetical protein
LLAFLLKEVRAILKNCLLTPIHHTNYLISITVANPYLNQQKPLFLPIMAYTLSTTKLEIRAK